MKTKFMTRTLSVLLILAVLCSFFAAAQTVSADTGSSNYLTYRSKGLTIPTTASSLTAQWTISISAGEAILKNCSATTYYLGFNDSANLFRCYTSQYGLYRYRLAN